jgi:arylsulfatase A-like enzyme
MFRATQTCATLLTFLLAATAEAGAQRLIDRLGAAEVVSPLQGVEATTSLDAADLTSTSLLTLTFERFTPNSVNWRGTPGCVGAGRPHGGGKALRYVGRNSHQCVFLLPVEPSTHYRVERQVLTSDPNVDFRAIETSAELSHPSTLNHAADIAKVMNGRFVRMTDLLFVHQLPKAVPGTWSNGAVGIFTSPKTRSLVLLLNDAEATLTGKAARAFFDDIRVARLEPTPAQELALLKASDPAEGADPAVGIAKLGRFLPIGDAETVAPPYDANFSFREALLAPAPSDLRFDVQIPTGGRLYFSNALHAMSRPGDEATFRVLVEANGGDAAELYRRTLRIGEDGQDWRWFEEQVDLSAYGGRRVRLTLETRATGGRGYALWGSPTIDAPRQKGDPPNVLLIAVDTLRADRLSAYGYGRPTSPRLAALARDGVTFDQAISPSNWTSPGFASLFTGLMPSEHQVIHRARAISPDVRTLAEYFRDGGWATHGVAYKAYLFNMGFEQGFDTFFNVPRADAKADANLATTLAWLQRHADRRFFLFVHFNDPHQPFNQPAPFERRFNPPGALKRFGLELPFVIGTSGTVVGCNACSGEGSVNSVFRSLGRDLYDGEIAYVDDRIGRLLDTLEKRGLYDDTIIAFVSDHGEIMWEHGDYFGHGGPWMFDSLIRVPLIIKPAARTGLARNKTVKTQVRSFDLMPTLLDLAGVPGGGADVTAESLVPFLATQGPAPAADRVAISENVKHDLLAVRYRGWKYILKHPPAGKTSERLYNLDADPGERADVSGRSPEQLLALRALAISHLLENRSGKYLLVSGDGERRRFKVRLRSNEPLEQIQTLFGPRLKRLGGGRTWVADGHAAGPVVLFARIDAPATAVLDVVVRTTGEQPVRIRRQLSAGRFDAYASDTAERLTGSSHVALHVFDTRPTVAHAERSGISAQRLETLEALGYVQ